MIQIYSPSNTDYTKNGDMPLLPTAASVHVILNGAWEAELTHPIDSEGRWEYIVEEAVVKLPSFNGEQLFRIKTKEKSDSGVTATMEPIFLDAMNDCFLVDVRPTGKNGQQALDLMTAPNSKYSGQSNITKTATAYYQFKNLIEAINGEEDNSFINRWGGEILFDNYTVIIHTKVGGDYGVELRYGKNIPQDGMSEEIDIRDVVTRIYPKAYNGYTMTNNGYVDSPLRNSYPTIKCATITFEDVKMAEDAQEDDEENGVIICDTQAELNAALTQKCNEQYAAGLDKPKVTISADMVLLQNTEQYQDYAVLETVSLGDTIHCINHHLGIVTDARVIELEYDALRQAVTAVVIGDFQYNYFQDVTSSVSRVDQAIRPDGSVIGEQVQGIIDGVKAQMKAQSSVAKSVNIRAIIMEDTDPDSPNYGAMCLGTMGFQIASKRTADGRDWDWTTFGTGQGFFADLIVAGTMLADRIKGGTLTLGGSNNQNGVLRIYDASGSEIGRWDKDGITLNKGAIAGPSITLGGSNNQNGVLRIYDASGNEIGKWDKDGVTLKKGNIDGPSISLGGNNNQNGILRIYDANGNEVGKWDKDGVYTTAGYVSVNSSETRRTTVAAGQISVAGEDGTTSGIISFLNNGITVQSYGGSSNSSLSCERDGSMNLWANGDMNIVCTGTLRIDSTPAKNGRAEFSDGSYLDFQHGMLVGGSTSEGGVF